MVDIIQNKEWAKSRTRIIINKINEVFNDNTMNESIDDNIQSANTDKLIEILENLIRNPIQFKYYIYTYLFEFYYKDEINTDYEAIEEDEYKEKIRELFRNNGIVGRRDINKSLKVLEKTAISVDRESVYLYAVGLNMPEEILEEIIKKGLLQRELNPRDYKEWIYRWCLKNVVDQKGIKAKELIKKYENNVFPEDKDIEYKLVDEDLLVESYDVTETLVDSGKIMLDKDEKEFLLFLKSMKKAGLKSKESSTLEDEYGLQISCLRKIDLITGEELLKEKTLESIEVDMKKIWESLRGRIEEKGGKFFYKQGEILVPLVDTNIMTTILKEVKITSKYVRGRIDNGKDVDRVLTVEKLEKSDNKRLYYILREGETIIDEERLEQEIKRQLEKDEVVLEEIDYMDSDGYEEKEDNIISSNVYEKSTEEMRINIFVQYKDEVEIYKMKKTKVKFADSEEYIDAYVQIDKKLAITREDLLLIKFITYAKGYESGGVFENNKENREMKKLRRKTIDGFMISTESMLKRVNMIEMYVNNPFDLFLIICMAQDNPFDYFMCSWAQIKA